MINLVIPAAGAATRLRPLSNNTSKAMVRVNGKPCIDYIIERANALAVINQIVIVDGKLDDIREYCAKRHPTVTIVKQEQLNGPRDAISIGISALNDPTLPLVVWLGDAIILDDNLELGTDFLLCKEVKDQSAWCMWDRSIGYFNKPSRSIDDTVALVGLYSFSNGDCAARVFRFHSFEISGALIDYCCITRLAFQCVIANDWYDIGDLPSYYKTCAALLKLKTRAFHTIEYDSELNTLCKMPDYHDINSINQNKNEKHWYSKLNQQQRMFVPRILKHPTDLIMSYESGVLLSDLMLYENLPESFWEYLIDKVFNVKLKYFNQRSNCSEYNNSFNVNAEIMWVSKTSSRLAGLNIPNGLSLDKIARRIYKETRPRMGVHGDLHFGNILYDQYSDRITLIDPRGTYGNIAGTYGDDLYDWCKLSHDLYHGYNVMVAGVEQNMIVKKVFVRKLKEYNLPVELIIEGGLLLLATCIPLHYDNKLRQERFLSYVNEYLKHENYSL